MNRGLVALLFLLLASPALALETWYFRDTAGAACGAGDREALNQTAGASVAPKVLDGTGDTWSRTESPARNIAAGNWQVCTDLDVAGGGGQAARVTWLVQVWDSACTTQQGADIINEQSANLTNGSTAEYCSTASDPGQINFSDNDILIVTVSKTQGTRTVTLRYNNSDLSDADSRLTHPDEAVAGSGRAMVVGGML